MWVINANSGSNYDIIEIEVLATLQQGIQVSVGEVLTLVTAGETIKVTEAQQTEEIEIISEDGEIIQTCHSQH